MAEVRAYLQLMRIPNVFTAQADLLAGYLISGLEGRGRPAALPLLLLASSSLYTAGVVLNDYFDFEVDRRERPQRPLPSGKVSRKFALGLGLSLLALGWLSGLAATPRSGLIGSLIVLAVLSYDGLTKEVPGVGSLNMGLCRYLNLLLGMSAAPFSAPSYLIPLLLLVFVASITTLSKGEVAGGSPWPGVRASVGLLLVMAGYASLHRAGILPNGLALWPLLALGLLALGRLVRVIWDPRPQRIVGAIQFLIPGIVLLDGLIVLGARGLPQGLMVAALLLPSVLLARYLYVT